jgi:hypothetical protein
MDSTDDSREYPCLVRVTDGKETQFSTHVRIFPRHMVIQAEPPIAIDYIRGTGQVPQRLWCAAQVIDEHVEKTRQKAREAAQ